MKKVFSLIIVLAFALSYNTFAQSVTIGTEVGPSPVDVPVSFVFTDDVYAFDLTISIPAGVTFLGETNVDPLLIGGSLWDVYQDGDEILIGWAADDSPSVPVKGNGGVPLTDSDDGILFYLSFSGVGGPHPLEFTSEDAFGDNAFQDTDQQIITTTFSPGAVTFTAPVPLSNWAIFIGLGLIIAFLVVRFRRIV